MPFVLEGRFYRTFLPLVQCLPYTNQLHIRVNTLEFHAHQSIIFFAWCKQDVFQMKECEDWLNDPEVNESAKV